MTTLTYTGTLEVCTCWCGIRLAVPDNLLRMARDEGHAIYCPLGHTFVFRDTYKQKLEQAEQRVAREQRRVEATRNLLHAEERSHSATRGHLTRQKKRVAAGVCPCCHRSFQQLARHMANKHPGFAS